MSSTRRRAPAPSTGDRYYCRACELYIADNRAQRLQHEGGARHAAAAAALVAGIARRNKEKAAVTAKEKAERDALAVRAVGAGRAGAGAGRARVDAAGVREEMMLRAHALAAAGRVAKAEPEGDGGDGGDGGGGGGGGAAYGQWEEVVDVGGAVVDGGGAVEGAVDRRKATEEMRIGAVDADDEEEAWSREACTGERGGDVDGKESAKAAPVIFKARTGRGNKRRRKAL